MKERVLERGLLYNPVPITPLRGRLELVAAQLHDPQQAERIVRALRRPDGTIATDPFELDQLTRATWGPIYSGTA